MRIFITIISATTLTGILLYCFGFQVNFTASMPKGIYLTKGGDIQRGDYVRYCIPANDAARLELGQRYLKPGSCPSGLQPLLKTVVGLPGDMLEFSNDGILINGHFIPNSAPNVADSNGEKINRIHGKGIIGDGYAIVLSPHINGFDSRYFGWVRLSDMQKVIPIFTFQNTEQEKD